MADSAQRGDNVRFSGFELDLASAELRKSGVKVRLQEQPFLVLRALVERPGEVVSREELQQRLWPDETFVDFEDGLSTAVRKIRQALGDSASNPRFIETLPKRGYRFIAPVEGVPSFESRLRPKRRNSALAAAAVIGLAMAGAGVWSLRETGRSDASSVKRTLLQVTSDPGLSAWPDITADGNLIVYSSDRDGGPDLDLWLRYIDRAETVQLTDEPGDEVEAHFSSDGSLVVYTSYPASRIYTVPTLGGEPRLIADHAKFPQFSPDGRSIAFSQGRTGWSNNLVLLDLDSGRRRVYGEDMDWLGAGLLWLPNGKLLSGGMRKRPRGDWYIVPLDGSEPVGTGSSSNLIGLSVSRPPPFEAQAWLEPEGGVLFSARQGDSTDSWRRPFSLETGKATGPPVRMTQGAALAHDVAASPGGRVVYASFEQNMDLWRLPMDINEGRPTGPVERLTRKPSSETFPVSAVGGGVLVYRQSPSPRNEARSQLFVMEEGSDTPRALLQGRTAHYSSINAHADGKTLTYSVPVTPSDFYRDTGAKPPHNVASRHPRNDVLEVALDDEVPRTVCESCPLFRGVSPNGRYRLHIGEGNDPRQVVAHEAGSNRQAVILSHPVYDLDGVNFSPDGDWVAFRAIVSAASRTKEFIAPFRLDGPPPEEEWIEIAPSATFVAGATWAPSGELLYYISNEGGPMAIRAVRLDPKTRRPVGKPWVVYESGSEGPVIRSFAVTGIGLNRVAVMADALVFDAATQRGNIWMLDPESEHAGSNGRPRRR